MKSRLFALGFAVISSLSIAQVVSAAIVEREPNDYNAIHIGKIELNKTFEVTGDFKQPINDSVDNYKVEVLGNGTLTVTLKSSERLLARVYHDSDGNGTVNSADQFIGLIESGQSMKARNFNSYIVRVLKPTNNGTPTYNVFLANQ